MFPGCTLTEMRSRQADLLREAQDARELRQNPLVLICSHTDLSLVFGRWVLSLFAILGSAITLR